MKSRASRARDLMICVLVSVGIVGIYMVALARDWITDIRQIETYGTLLVSSAVLAAMLSPRWMIFGRKWAFALFLVACLAVRAAIYQTLWNTGHPDAGRPLWLYVPVEFIALYMLLHGAARLCAARESQHVVGN